MVKFTVDYYKTEDAIGGVQAFMQDLCSIYPDFRNISYKDAMYPMLGGYTMPKDFGQFEVEMSGIFQDYIDKYERVNPLDVIVKNSIVGTFEKHRTPTICIIQDNNLLGPLKLYRYGFYPYHSYNIYGRIFPLLQETTIRNSDLVVTTSEQVKECYDKRFGVESEIIPNGIDTGMFRPLLDKAELRKKYGIPEGMKVGISVTAFLQIKGWHILQRLINEFQDVFWIIVFKHNSNPSKLPNVKVFNRLPREQLSELYGCADFFLLPSAMETCNLAGLEAIACGLPVIVANAGYFWSRDLAKGYEYMDSGIRVEDWNYEAYRDALRDFLQGEKWFNVKGFIERNKLDLGSWKSQWKGAIESVMEKKR